MKKNMPYRFIWFALMSLIIASGDAFAASTETGTGQRLKEIERQLESSESKAKALRDKAELLETEIEDVRFQMMNAALKIKAYEQKVIDLKGQLVELGTSQSGKNKMLNSRRGQMASMLVALQRVARNPPEALITRPISPADTVRSAILLRAVIPEIERRAVDLRSDLQEIVIQRDEIVRRQLYMEGMQQTLIKERKDLKSLAGRKSRLRRRTVAKSNDAQIKLKKLALEASSLRELMAKLAVIRKQRLDQEKLEAAALAKLQAEKNTENIAKNKSEEMDKRLKRKADADALRVAKWEEQQAAEAARQETEKANAAVTSGSKKKSKIKTSPYLPVAGSVIASYGQAGDGGMTHKGITIETTQSAQVVAPRKGRVVFADNFRGYGLLLIIEHDGGYHTLLSGLSRIDGVVGQRLLAGEPIGVMGDEVDNTPKLYVELRHNSQPVNPMPWLAAQENKVNG